jgi:hypothetical protein
MKWQLSRFRVGDIVEVRSKQEILATLDAKGCNDRMPFMPEMLQYCGRRFRVGAVAHKTCDVAQQTLKSRRLGATVHLVGVRCDGSAHGGCQAECNLFWKDAWLKPAADSDVASQKPGLVGSPACTGISEPQLMERTRLSSDSPQPDAVYSCQATQLFAATDALAWWNPKQYLRDVTTGNHSLRYVLGVLLVACLKHLHKNAPRGYRLTKHLYESMHRRLLGRELPEFRGAIRDGRPTPTGRLDLRPGERVRIKSKVEIEATLDAKGRNRGLYFDVELSPYCGSVTTVRKSVTQFIDEATGKMCHAKQPCIMLDGVACKAEYSQCRLLCPRSIPSYWREVWLERTGDEDAVKGPACDHRL